jgi:hypothetical protein
MGSGGSSQQQSSQQNISQTQLPPWVNQAAQQNYALAQNVASRPLTQYAGQQVADTGPQMQQGWNLAATSGAQGADQFNAAQAAMLTAAGTPATQVTPQSLAGTNLQPYMNPYTQSVINATLPIMQQQLGQQQSGIQGQAAAANAYGGSRQGIQQGVAQSQGALNMANMAAGLNQANFTQAQQAATGDISRNLAAQQSNQGANQQNINSLIAAGQGLGTLGQDAQTNQRQQFLELSTAGGQEQQQAQNQIQANMNQFNQAQMYPGQQLGVLQSALGMTPYGSTTMGASSGQQTTTQNPSLASDIFGGLQSLGSLASAPAGGTSALSGLSALFGSDKALKTDITPIGTHPPTGLPLYSYRYKGDPKSYPKVSGPMAEDVMKVAPHAVTTVGIHQPTGQPMHGVDMSALNAAGGSGGMPGAGAGLPGGGLPPMPAIRPRALPGAQGGMTTRVPGALAPPAPMGMSGAMGANMRPPKLRQPTRMPKLRGALGG